MPYPVKTPVSGGDVDTSSLVQKSNNLSDVANKTQALLNLGGMPKTDVDGVATFAQLRTRQPAYEGERVYIKCHTPSALSVYMPEGGGWFIGRMNAQADDGGYVASSGKAWHWQRDKAIDTLTIADFGGVADGVTDCQPAFQANYNFLFGSYARIRTGGTQSGSAVSGGVSPYLTIRFNAGNYYITPGEYNKSGGKIASGSADLAFNPSGYAAAAGLRIEGAFSESGKQVLTWFTSDKSDKPVFLLNHRRLSVKGVAFNGQQTTAIDQYNVSTNPNGTNRLVGATMGIWNDTASNKQQFIYNECPGGCYLKISCCSYQDIGGDMFFVKDTLDTKIDQVFGSKNAAPVFTTSWSGQTTGVWDHSTSVEIRNCNFGTPLAPAIRAPRCAQSIMFNVWAEHGTTPFDLNNGQWDMSMVCVEDCRTDMCLWNSKWTMRTLSTPTGNDVSEASPTSGSYTGFLTNPDGSSVTGWTEAYGLGSWLMMNYGAYFNCPVRARYFSPIIRGTNNTDSDLWVNVGRFTSQTSSGAPNGTSWRIRVHGSRYYNQSSTANMLSDESPGVGIIDLGRGTGATPKCKWYNDGSGPIRSVSYKPQQYNTEIPELWVCIKGRVGEYGIFVESTGSTRREAGAPSNFEVSGATSTSAPSGLTAVNGLFSFNNGQAGIGARTDLVMLHTRVATAAATPVESTPVTYMRMDIRGQQLAVPVFAFVPQFTTQPASTVSVATGGTLTLTAVVTDAVSYQWQKSTDSGATWTSISGATTATYTKASVTSADAGQYRLVARANNGTGGNGTNYYSNVSTVTVT